MSFPINFMEAKETLSDRVKEYLLYNEVNSDADIDSMVKNLRRQHLEYNRFKYTPFRAIVQNVYSVVEDSLNCSHSENSDIASELCGLNAFENTNASNNFVSNMMSSLYNKSKGSLNTSRSGTVSTYPKIDDAIRISSDDSSLENETIVQSSNGDTNDVVNKNIPNKNDQRCTGSNRREFSSGEYLSRKRKAQDRLHGSTNPWSTDGKYFRLKASNGKNRNAGAGCGDDGGAGSQMSMADYLNDDIEYNRHRRMVPLRKKRETFHNIGGMEKNLKELCELLLHIKSPDLYFALGMRAPRGILLHGPPGCGKTLLAHAISGQLNLPMIEVAATELIAGVSGGSEERIRDVFQQAERSAPCIMFIDEIDAISANRATSYRDMDRRIVSQLISSFDSLQASDSGRSVLVIAATTRPDALDPGLRRVGRFDHEICIGFPTRKERKEILIIICKSINSQCDCDYDKVAEITPGYVGADLLALVSRAAIIAFKRKCTQQIQAFINKPQLGVTIVDLDDDNEDDNEAFKEFQSNKIQKVIPNEVNESEVQKCSENNEIKENQGQKDSSLSEAITTTAKCLNTTDVIGESTLNDNIMMIDENMDTSNSEKSVNTDHQNEKCEEMDSLNLDKSGERKLSNDLSKVDSNDTPKKMVEPSLSQLIYWLDNPPDELTCVTEFKLTMDDFYEALKVVQPSAKREGFITIPDVTWDDIGSLQDIRDELKLAVFAPVKYPEKMDILGLSAPSGILLCGPPGCGKTLLAKAVANEAGINFISVKGPEIINKFVGESERAVRSCFQRARNSAPCVIFFDEFDALCPKRDSQGDGSFGPRVVNQLLTEMDGIEGRKGVYILAATNRPDIIDPAILRPGRLDTILYVGLPEKADRVEILKAATKNRTQPVLAKDVNFEELAEHTDGYTGADLAGLVRQAALLALKESLTNEHINNNNLCVEMSHFKSALSMIRPSINDKDRKLYEALRLKYAAPRSTNQNVGN